MAQIKLKIEVNPDAETETLGDVSTDVDEVSNVSFKVNSNGVYQAISSPQTAIKGHNGLSLGKPLIFNKDGFLDNADGLGATLEDESNPKEFVWGFVPSSKEYSVKLTFTNANNLKDIVVYGDDVVGQFPTRAVIDGTKIVYSDDSRWAINLEKESNTHTIVFTHWNKAEYNACLTLIQVMLRYYEIDGGDVKQMSSLTQMAQYNESINYNVVYGNGELLILDRDGELEDLITDGIIESSKVPVDIYIDNTKIASHITSDCSYNKMERELSLSLTSRLGLLDNMIMEDMRDAENLTLYDIVYKVISSLGYTQDQFNNMLQSYVVYGDGINDFFNNAKFLLENIRLEMYYFIGKSYREVLNICCEIAQLKVIDDKDTVMRFVDARPKIPENATIISVPAYSQLSRSIDGLITPNKTTYVSITQGKEIIEDKYAVSDGSDYYVKIENVNFDNEETKEYMWKTYNVSEVTMSNGYVYYVGYFSQNALFSYNNATKILSVGEPYYTSKVKGAFNTDTSITRDTFYGEVLGYNSIKDFENFIDNSQASIPNILNKIIFVGFLKDSESIGTMFNRDITFMFAILKGTPTDYANTIEELKIGAPAEIVKFGDFSQVNVGTNQNYTLEINNENPLLLDTAQAVVNKENTRAYEIAQSIIYDYSQGIRFGKCTLVCMDYYSTTGEKVIDWQSRDLIKVGDFIEIDKDNNGTPFYTYKDGTPLIAKVVSVEISKIGVPKLDIIWQEVKP